VLRHHAGWKINRSLSIFRIGWCRPWHSVPHHYIFGTNCIIGSMLFRHKATSQKFWRQSKILCHGFGPAAVPGSAPGSATDYHHHHPLRLSSWLWSVAAAADSVGAISRLHAAVRMSASFSKSPENIPPVHRNICRPLVRAILRVEVYSYGYSVGLWSVRV